jgi:Predicted membrane protein
MLRHRSFETGRFDLGNMVQAVWSTAHGHPLRVTTLTGEQAFRLGAHIDPVLMLFAPLWWLWPSPDLLLVAQALAIALGALPVYWLALSTSTPSAQVSASRSSTSSTRRRRGSR